VKTINLGQEQRTLTELLALAKREALLIHSATGDDFLLEPADDFDREVAALGRSERFMSFLSERSAESGDRPLSDVRKEREYPGVRGPRPSISLPTERRNAPRHFDRGGAQRRRAEKSRRQGRMAWSRRPWCAGPGPRFLGSRRREAASARNDTGGGRAEAAHSK
jgi:hypothetical protein